MKLLQAVKQHGPILFLHNVFPDVHSVISVHTKDVAVERTMVDAAE